MDTLTSWFQHEFSCVVYISDGHDMGQCSMRQHGGLEEILKVGIVWGVYGDLRAFKVWKEGTNIIVVQPITIRRLVS